MEYSYGKPKYYIRGRFYTKETFLDSREYKEAMKAELRSIKLKQLLEWLNRPFIDNLVSINFYAFSLTHIFTLNKYKKPLY
jgi:hypothetical protein